MTEQLKAEAYVRSQRPALMELTFGCEVIGGAFNKPMFYKHYGIDTCEYGQGEDGHHLMYKGKNGGCFTRQIDFKIVGHPIQLNDWLAGLPNVITEGITLCAGQMQIVCDTKLVTFNLTTGQPNSPEDYKTFNDIVGV